MRAIVLTAASLLWILTACTSDYDLDNGGDVPGLGDDSDGNGDDDDDDDDDGIIYGDSWDLSGDIATDIIIYGDTSSSMEEELTTMGDNILALTDRLKANSANWHLMAVTGPSGCAVNGWLTAAVPGFDDIFSDAILTKPVPDTEDEMGLQNVERAVSEAFGGCNEGFLRPDAMLHIIFVSDENDESPGFSNDGYWQNYIDSIITQKGSEALVKVSAVAGPAPAGCNGADPGFGYAEVVGDTSGEFVSICEDWPNQLDTLADASIQTEVFDLSRDPKPSTIVVYVNQSPVTGTWDYEQAGNLVRFHTDPPQTGDIVDIEYETK